METKEENEAADRGSTRNLSEDLPELQKRENGMRCSSKWDNESRRPQRCEAERESRLGMFLPQKQEFGKWSSSN
jgi:hypothetical protein